MNTKFIVLALLCLSGTLAGQTKLGIKGSFGTSYTSAVSKEFVTIQPASIQNIGFKSASPRASYGMSLYSENDKLFLMSDLFYSSSSSTYSIKSNSLRRTPLDPEIVYKNNSQDIRVVVNGGLKFKNFKLGAGPELSYNLSTEENFSELPNVTAMKKKYKTGFNFLVGYKLSDHIHVDLRHTYIFQDVSDMYKHGDIPLDLRQNVKYLELSLGFYL